LSEITTLSNSWIPSSPGDSRPPEDFPHFHIGEILRGKILSRIGSQQALLQMGARNLLVETRLPLPLNQDLQFRVEEVQPRVILKIIPPEREKDRTIDSLLKNYLSLDVPLENLAEKLTPLAKMGKGGIPPSLHETWKKFFTLLSRFSPHDLFSSLPDSLRQLLSQAGFFWENKIGQWIEAGKKESPAPFVQEDLKGLGMKLLARLQESPSLLGGNAEDKPGIGELKGILESFLQKVELYQIFNLSHSPEKVFFFLPLWWENHLQFVELGFSFPQEGSSSAEDRELSVLFLLTLPDLGKIRIEVRIQEKDLFCRFLVSDRRSSEFIHPFLSGLQGRLEQLGFQAHIQLSVELPEKLEAPLIQDPEMGSKSLFSITV